MELSIITINYNNKDGLQKTIDSVISQTWRDFEWIVIDGGSTDGSKELMEKYQDHFAYWCSEPDKGIYNAMNKGIAKAQGEYCLFLNSGDNLHDHNVLGRVFNNVFSADVIYGDVNFLLTDINWVNKYPDKLSTHFFLANTIGHPGSFIKRSLFQEGGYPENLKIASDYYYFLKWFREGKTFSHIDLIVSDYDTSGVSSTNNDLMEKETDSVRDEICGIENKEWVSESIRLYRELDTYRNDGIIRLYKGIKKRGGLRLALLYKIMKFFIKTIKLEQKCAHYI